MPRIQVDLRLIELDAELDALRRFRAFVEPQIRELQRREHERMDADLRATGPGEDGEYLQLAWQERDFIAEHTVPRFFRGPLLVATWAVYENAVSAVGQFLAEASKTAVRLDDLRGDFLSRAVKYFGQILRFQLDSDEARLSRIRDWLWLRNFLAHRNGRAYRLSEAYRRDLDGILKKHDSLRLDARNCLILEAEFLARACDDLAVSAGELINRARGGPSVRLRASKA